MDFGDEYRIRNQIANVYKGGYAASMITRTLASKIESMAGTFPVVTVDLRLELRRVAKLLTETL